MTGKTQYTESIRGELDKPLALDLEERKPQVEALFGTYKRDCYNNAYSILRNHYDAEDVVQLVFLRVATTPSVFRGESSIRTWFSRITRRVAINMYHKNRARGRRDTFSIEESEGDFLSSAPSPIEEVILNETAEDAKREVGNLSEVSKRLLRLRNVEGLSYKQIADTLGCKLGTVKSRMARVRQDLREKVGL